MLSCWAGRRAGCPQGLLQRECRLCNMTPAFFRRESASQTRAPGLSVRPPHEPCLPSCGRAEVQSRVMPFLSVLVVGQAPLTDACGRVGVGIETRSNALFKVFSLGAPSPYYPLLACPVSSLHSWSLHFLWHLCHVCLPDQNMDSLKAGTPLCSPLCFQGFPQRPARWRFAE